MKIDIHDHPALQIPHDPDSLRDLILLYIGMLREEEPFYLMHELSLPRRHIKLLKMIIAGKGMLDHDDLHAATLPPVSEGTYRQRLSRLSRRLGKAGISFTGGRTPSIDVKGCERIEKIVDGFHRNSKLLCSILGTRSLDITRNDLPRDGDRYAQTKLRHMLGDILEFIRGDPTQIPGVNVKPSTNEKILLGVYDAALESGMGFVPYYRFELSLYPPFIATDVNTYAATEALLSGLHKKLGCPPGKSGRSPSIHVIAEPVRRALIRPYADSSYASPPNNTSSLAASSPG